MNWLTVDGLGEHWSQAPRVGGDPTPDEVEIDDRRTSPTLTLDVPAGQCAVRRAVERARF